MLTKEDVTDSDLRMLETFADDATANRITGKFDDIKRELLTMHSDFRRKTMCSNLVRALAPFQDA